MNKWWTGALACLAMLGATMMLKSEMTMEKTDAEGHVLTRQWQAFHKASNADRPQEMTRLLEEIVEKAKKKHLSKDFYDAGREWVYAVQRRNWKEREGALKKWAEQVAEFDEPIVTLAWMEEFQRSGSNSRFEYVQKNSARLRAGRHKEFYDNLTYMDGNLYRFLKDDEEYALWRILGDRYYDGKQPEKDEVYAALAEREAGKYPAEPYLKYVAANRIYSDEKADAMEALLKAYPGKAVSMYPQQVVIQHKYNKLIKDKAPEEAYKALRDECEAIEKARKAFRGDEKVIASPCEGVKDVLENLTGKEIDLASKGRRIHVIFKNLPKADVQFCSWREDESDKVLWTREVLNKKGRFYLKDTTTFTLPEMDDGEYILKSTWAKDCTAKLRFTQFRLSLAVRAEADGLAAYAADYASGEPVSEADVILLKGGKELFRERIAFQGFTHLPERFLTEMRKGSRELQCEYTGADGFVRRSEPVSVWSTTPSFASNGAYNGYRCNIYKDRGAYNPGNTLQFKAVVYKGNLMDDNQTVPAGTLLTAKLLDSESNEIAKQELETGEFGSAAGSFVIPTGLRNGFFSLQIFRKDATSPLTTDSFRVDEFVLPTFELRFDKREGLYFEGDSVPVSGTVRSFSGHSLSGARLALEIRRWGNHVVYEEEVPISEDATFKTAFPALDSGFFHIVAKVTDGTGETLEFTDYVYVINGVSLSLQAEGAASGEVTLANEAKDPERLGRWYSPSVSIITTPDATYAFQVTNTDRQPVPGVEIRYVLKDEKGTAIEEGTALSGEKKTFALPASGLYTLKANVYMKSPKGNEIKAEQEVRFLRVLPGDNALDAPVWKFFQVKADEVGDGETFGLRFGAADGPVWAVVTLYQDGGKILEMKPVRLEGARGKAGSITDLEYTWKAEWPEAVRMNVFFFRDGQSVSYDHEFRHRSDRLALPLSFSSFTDKAFPGTEYTVTLQTGPGVEALAAAWDKSLDAIAANGWPVIQLRTYHAASLSHSIECGEVGGSSYRDPIYYDYAAGGPRLLAKGATRSAVNGAPVMVEEAMVSREVADEAVPFQLVEEKPGFDPNAEDVAVREKFEEALTFQPFLRSGKDGKLSFSFRTSDKLSTYYVAVYAHDKDLRNAYVREEMVVSVPVKVSVSAPRYLYEGDLLQLAANVSSNAEAPVSGTLYLYVYDTADHAGSKPVSVQRYPVKVPAGGSLAKTFAVRLPKTDTLGLKTVFVAKEFSDAVFDSVPVLPRSQTLTEAHSAVLLAGMDEQALLRELRSRFVNVPAKKAESSVITVLDMVRDAIPDHVEPKSNNVIALSEAYYTRLLAARLKERYPDEDLPDSSPEPLLEQILACRNSDGGFGWFEGMRSSAVVTAVLLDRFAKLDERGFDVPDLTSSVKWLDTKQFTDELPYWCGWVSDEQYMHIRARYAWVPFEVKQTGDKKAFDKRMASFKEYAQDYLVPSEKDGRGLKGQILAKSRRIATLRSLLATDEGKALAKAWGIRFGTESKLRNSMDADFLSLVEYAVEHRDGGWYYPNAVMPYRGLLESEAYAHALLTDLLSDYAAEAGSASTADTRAKAGTIADGLRIWLMLQKETQKWGDDAAYVDAVTSILDGSERVLATKVLVLKATYSKPFEQIKAAGNGFTVERKFYREKKVEKTYSNRTSDETWIETELEEIRPGTPLAVGDKILVEYAIWNQENRSFVLLTAPREASLMPVQQLSGHCGWSFRPLGIPGYGWSITPQGYRNVKADRTEFYYDSFPEEKTTLTEAFYVTRAGTFTAPVVTIESLYAPHYRANAAFPGALTAR